MSWGNHSKNIGFRECTSLTSITLPEGLEAIDIHAFILSGLQSINLPSTLKSLGADKGFKDGYVFAMRTYYGDYTGCEYLTNVAINSDLNNMEYIYDKENLFNGCDNIMYVCFGEKVKGIPTALFKDKNNLEIVLFSNAVEEIGVSGGLFAPMENVTRAQFVHMIVNAFGFTGNGIITFSDVSNQWFANSVLTAANNGLVSGYDGRFNPDDNITCQDAAVILKRVLDMKGVNLPAPVTAAETIGADYALDAIGVLRANGVIKPEMGFAPFLYASRAQAAYMIYGAYKLYMGIQ